ESVAAAVRHYDARRRLAAGRQSLESQGADVGRAKDTRLLERRGAVGRRAAVRQSLESQVANLAAATHTRLLESRGALDPRTASLEALSPVAILNRGYA